MATLCLSIEPDLCGAVSVGTASVIRALMAHSGLSVDDASALVNRCVFDAERVTLAAPSRAAAEALLAALRNTPAAPRISAVIAD
jgi:hypothetical protein